MRFGQLQIFRPDGPLETILLDGETIGIGRSPGNFLVLDRNGVSRYHVTLTLKDNEVYLEDLDSVNGTYVDGVSLPGNEPRLLRGGEEIQIADVRLVFQPVLDVDVTVGQTTQTIELGNIRLELEGPDMAVTPGAHVGSMVTIENLANDIASFKVMVEGIPDGWARVDRPELAVPPGEKREVRINFKPRRHSESKPGEYDFVIKVTEDATPDKPHIIKSRLHVLTYSGFGVALANSEVQSDSGFQMYIHNQGNGPLSLNLRGESPSGKLAFQLNPPSLILGAGERRTVLGKITSKQKKLVGGTYEERFDVICHSNDASGFQAPISGRYVEKAALPLWAILASAAIAISGIVAVVFFALVLFGGDDNTPSSTSVPTSIPVAISNFQVNKTDTIVGSPVLITWDVEGADLVSLNVKHEVLDTQTYALPDVSGINYEVSIPSAGRYDLELQATGSGGETSQIVTVFVKPQLNLAVSTSVTPVGATNGPQLALYRNLEQTITISWVVNWTANPETDPRVPPTVILDSLPLDYMQQDVPLESPPQAITILSDKFVPSLANVRITLLSNGPDNLQSSFEVSIPILDPVCNATTTISIYGGPDVALYPELTSLDAGTIRVDGRNPDADWLRIHLPPNANIQRQFGWVSADQVDCVFEVSNLRASEVPPVPDQVETGPTPSTLLPPIGGGDPAGSPTPPPPTPTRTRVPAQG